MSATTPSSRPAGPTYAGERLGLPPGGRGAVVGWGRRFLALFVDWIASTLVALVLVGPRVMTARDWEAWMPMLVFLLETAFLAALLGGSFGQLLTRIAVVGVHGRPLTLLRALLRSLLVCLVVPPLIYNADRRGLHDLLAGTVVVRR